MKEAIAARLWIHGFYTWDLQPGGIRSVGERDPEREKLPVLLTPPRHLIKKYSSPL